MMEQTSLQAFEEIKIKLGGRQQQVLQALKHFNNKGEDATDYELAVYLGQSDPNYVRPRRYELVNKFKLVGFSQKRVCSVSGKMALAWKVMRTRLDIA
jgi:hypothetical protein